MQVQLTCREQVTADGAATAQTVETHGRILFVDLAGSERLHQSGSAGGAAKETAHINKSLFALGNVISALSGGADGGRVAAHIPYRDSKLTKLLSDSLGGSSMAMMIGCVSPAADAVDESLNTLNYLSAAKKITNRPVVHTDESSDLTFALKHLQEEMQALRRENAVLRQQLVMSASVSSISSVPQATTPGAGSPFSGATPQLGGPPPSGHQIQPRSRAPSLDQVPAAKDRDENKRAVKRLHEQNAHLELTNKLLQRSYNDMKRENDMLLVKLDRLERIFVESGAADADPTTGAVAGAEGASA